MSITITNHWTLQRKGYCDLEIRSLSDGTYQMLGYRYSRGEERWVDLNYSEEEILRYVELYGKDYYDSVG